MAGRPLGQGGSRAGAGAIASAGSAPPSAVPEERGAPGIGASLVTEGVVLVGYEDRMGDAYAASDLVLCRAGSSTLAELTVLGKPSVLRARREAPGLTRSARLDARHVAEKFVGTRSTLYEQPCSA